MIRKIVNENAISSRKPHIITKDELKELNDYIRENGSTEYIDTYRDSNSIYTDITWGDWKHDHLWIEHLVREFFINRGVYVEHKSFVTDDTNSDTYSAEHIWTLYDLPKSNVSESANDAGIVKTLDDMLSGLVDNVPENVLNQNIKLFNRIVKELGVEDFSDVHVFIHDGTYDLWDYEDKFEFVKSYNGSIGNAKDVKVFKFGDKLLVQEFYDTGRYFIYAKSENDLDDVVDTVDNYYNDTEHDQKEILKFLNELPDEKLGRAFYLYNTHSRDELSYVISDEDLKYLGFTGGLTENAKFNSSHDKYVHQLAKNMWSLIDDNPEEDYKFDDAVDMITGKIPGNLNPQDYKFTDEDFETVENLENYLKRFDVITLVRFADMLEKKYGFEFISDELNEKSCMVKESTAFKYDDTEDIADFLDTLLKTNRDKLKELMDKYGVKNNYNLARKISDEDLDELGYEPPKFDAEEYKDWFDKYTKDNDKYFPRVDIKNDRYDYYKYDNRDFAYDKDNSTVVYLFRDANEVSELGDEAPYRELDAIDFSEDDWKNKDERDWHLSKYIDNLNAEVHNLMNDFIKYELPESHKKESATDTTVDVNALKDTHKIYEVDLNVEAEISEYDASSEDEAKENSKEAVDDAVKNIAKEIKNRIDKKIGKNNTYVEIPDYDLMGFKDDIIYTTIYIDKEANEEDIITVINELKDFVSFGETTFDDFDYSKGSRVSGYNIPASYAGWMEYSEVESELTVAIEIKSIKNIKQVED